MYIYIYLCGRTGDLADIGRYSTSQDGASGRAWRGCGSCGSCDAERPCGQTPYRAHLFHGGTVRHALWATWLQHAIAELKKDGKIGKGDLQTQQSPQLPPGMWSLLS